MKFESARPDTSFLEFAEQHQDLTGYIKHLTLSGQGLRWGITTTPVLVLDALVSILSKLPALLRLSLSSFRFLSRTDSQIEGPRSTPFALRRLDVLDFCQATSLRSAVADLAGLLSAFTVRTLEFGRVHHYRVDNTAYGTACTHRFDVPNLVVWVWGMSKEIGLVVRRDTLRSLRVRHLLRWMVPEYIVVFLRDHGRNITELDLDLSWIQGLACRAPPALSPQLMQVVGEAASSCRALEALVLRIDEVHPTNSLVFSGLLGTLEAGALRKIVLSVDRASSVWPLHLESDEADEGWDWKAVDTLLSRARYPMLDSVVLAPQRPRAGDTQHNLYSAAAKMLPAVHNAGLLQAL
ncbi:hypothetical protein BD310DRAFT_952618 [Dichomitus squalens]|uniref:Uncharacterized protein n=1 Tax=Dichomitus squalens TaxID=114155 RepID=A0A4Q9PD89_9APHY|nr:hypothetical protein BD310DRAFT_952618 [Dichomitus squalens]